MGVMTIAEAFPPAGQLLTVDDLDRTPDDGRRHELVDGVLVVSPAPGIPHQEAVSELLGLLREVCPRGLGTAAGAAVPMSLSTVRGLAWAPNRRAAAALIARADLRTQIAWHQRGPQR